MNEKLERQVQQALTRAEVADSELGVLLQALMEERQMLLRRQERIAKISDGYQAQLRQAHTPNSCSSPPKTITGLLPVCYCCKKVRDGQGRWDEVESFLSQHTEAVLSQGICPGCLQEAMTTHLMPRRTHVVRGNEDEKLLWESLKAEGIREDNPLLGSHLDLARRFHKVSRRLDKISKISDGYQSQLKELNATLQQASLTDTLTGIANRRAMLERLKSEANRAQRDGKTFTVLMLDLDHFKRINDTHGHDAGDLVIVAVAQTLENNLRNFDFCARWGGEEFLVLLTSTTMQTAIAVSEKLRVAVSAHEITYDGQRIPISFSGGLALHPVDGNINETLKHADRALYSAKSAGRNRVVTAQL